MAEKNTNNQQPEKPEKDDLDSLPPLSEFESSEGLSSDSGLPPLGSSSEEPFSGLPPISDIPVETPEPTGGAIKPPPSSIELGGAEPQTPVSSGGFETPISDSAFDTPTLTPARSQAKPGTGFEELVRDSDFNPETPAVGLTSGTDLDTPSYGDSFGKVEDASSTPTRTMETPIFGGTSSAAEDKDFGFGGGDFGGGFGGGVAPTTPPPDFRIDTGGPQIPPTPPPVEMKPPARPAPKKKGGVVGVLVSILLLIVGLAVGVVLGPMVSYNYLKTLPMNPWKAELDKAQTQMTSLKSENESLKRQIAETAQLPPEQQTLSVEEIEALRQQKVELTAQVAAATDELQARRNELAELERDIELKNEEYLKAEREYEDLANQTAITTARRDGLLAEVDRLQSQVGLLEEADQRRVMTKEALEHAIDLLAVTIRENIPLTPEKYSHAARVAAVEQLKAKASAANWVDPELLREYTALYRKELEIARAREYFFAKIPTRDRFGTDRDVWAECVMNGNWSVYYRTIDGKNIGIFQNVADSGAPRYDFVQNLPPEVIRTVESTIASSRTPDYLERIQVLAEKQNILERKTPLQKVYDSM